MQGKLTSEDTVIVDNLDAPVLFRLLVSAAREVVQAIFEAEPFPSASGPICHIVGLNGATLDCAAAAHGFAERVTHGRIFSKSL